MREIMLCYVSFSFVLVSYYTTTNNIIIKYLVPLFILSPKNDIEYNTLYNSLTHHSYSCLVLSLKTTVHVYVPLSDVFWQEMLYGPYT